jgi:hypothetical protein
MKRRATGENQMRNGLVCVGLFAGVGGFEEGLRRIGCRATLLCESDPAARRVLSARFPEVDVIDDVRRMSEQPASPPNPYVAGKPGYSPRSSLRACADVAAPPGLAASQCAHAPGMACGRGCRRRGCLRRPACRAAKKIRPQFDGINRFCNCKSVTENVPPFNRSDQLPLVEKGISHRCAKSDRRQATYMLPIREKTCRMVV